MVDAASGKDAEGADPRAASSTIRLTDETKLEIGDDDLARLLPAGTTLTGITVLEPAPQPDLHAYWIPKIVDPGPGVASGARWLASVAASGRIALDIPPGEGQGTLALYSLGHDTTVGVIHFRPPSMVFRSCK